MRENQKHKNKKTNKIVDPVKHSQTTSCEVRIDEHDGHAYEETWEATDFNTTISSQSISDSDLAYRVRESILITWLPDHATIIFEKWLVIPMA